MKYEAVKHLNQDLTYTYCSMIRLADPARPNLDRVVVWVGFSGSGPILFYQDLSIIRIRVEKIGKKCEVRNIYTEI